MIDVKSGLRGGMDLDTSYYNLRGDAYVDALNVTRDASVSGNDDIISNLVGNRIFAFTLPAGTNKEIGAYANTLANTIISFVYNSNSYHTIIEYDMTPRTSAKIFQNLTDSNSVDVLGFTVTGKITGINIYPSEDGDLLFFLDSLGRPTEMNITRMKAGQFTPVSRDIIKLHKRPPLSPPTSVYSNDTTRQANNFLNKLTRYRYRWVFFDNYKSTASPISTVPLPPSILDPVYTNVFTNNNLINILLNSGPKNVKAIELWLSISEHSNQFERFVLAKTINKTEILLTSTQTLFPTGGTTRAVIVFSGVVTTGAVINIYLTLLPSTQTLVGTYTTLAGDSITSIYNGLAASITAIGIGTSPSVGGWGIYFDFNNVLYSFDEVQINLAVTTVDDTDFQVSFYNDSTYPFISDDESLQLFDYVPDAAVAQEEPNGNVIAFGNITEGYDRDLTPNVTITVLTTAAGTGGALSTLGGVASQLTTVLNAERWKIDFTGAPATGTVTNVYLRSTPGGVQTLVATYTAVSGDTALSVVNGLKASMAILGPAIPGGNCNVILGDASGVFPLTTLGFAFTDSAYNYDSFTITNPTVSASNSLATWKWSTERNVAISYYDQTGKTNGILYNAKVTFPAYSENGSQVPMLPYINLKIYHVPPDWAYSYQISFTKEPTQYLFFEAVAVNSVENEFIYFDITNLAINQAKQPTTAAVISWSFQDGDRMRLIRRMSDGFVYGASFDTFVEGIVTSPKINNVTQTDKTFVKIKKYAPFAAEVYTSNFFVIELYRPGQQPPNNSNAVFYESGIEFDILDPTTATRRHQGSVSDQTANYVTPAEMNIYQGDSYFRNRTIALAETGVGSYNVQDRNFVDFYISAVSSIDGRPLTIEINAKEATYGALVRHSEAYQPNTNVNGLNRFYANNFLDCDTSYGGIMRLSGRDRLMKVFQRNKTGRIPLFSQVGKSATGDEVTVVTDRLLNPIQYYAGNWGIGTAGTSLSSFNFADYFIDNIRGAILRSSNDGIDVLSIIYKVNSWATQELPLRTSPSFAYGAFDQKLNNYILALEAAEGSAAQTLSFSEGWDTDIKPSFESFLSLFPDGMVTIGTLLCSFKDGAMWTHDSGYNSFFGVAYESSVTVVFNDKVLEGKSLLAIEQTSNTIWDIPEITTQVNTYGTTKQQSNLKEAEFTYLEGKYGSAIKRDTNSPGGKINGDILKGGYVKVKFRKQDASNLITLDIVKLKYIESPLNTR